MTIILFKCQCVKLDEAKHYKKVLNKWINTDNSDASGSFAFIQLLQSMSDERVEVFATRPIGSVGIRWTLHNGVKEIYKFVFLLEKY